MDGRLEVYELNHCFFVSLFRFLVASTFVSRRFVSWKFVSCFATSLSVASKL